MFTKLLNEVSNLSQRKILLMAAVAGVSMFGLLYATLSQMVDTKMEQATQQKIIEEQKQEQTIKIVTAATDILSRTLIQENMLQYKEVPESMKTADTMTDISKIIGKPARVDILQGDVITERKFFTNMDKAGFIGLIPADCRAISIGISDITGVSGFMNPGDYVDVMLVSEGENSTIKTELILQDVLLLAIGKMASQSDEGIVKGVASSVANAVSNNVSTTNNNEKSSSTATLALHVDEVMKVAAAARKGTLYLVLRPFQPTEEIVANTDYYMEGSSNRSNSIQDFVPATNVPTTTPAFQPPASPVTNAVPNVATNQFIVPNGIEIIQGDQVKLQN